MNHYAFNFISANIILISTYFRITLLSIKLVKTRKRKITPFIKGISTLDCQFSIRISNKTSIQEKSK